MGPYLTNLDPFLNAPPSKNRWFYLFQWKSFKKTNVPCLIWKAVFIIGKRLDKKAKVNFKSYDVTKWNTKNYNKHIPKYLKHIWAYWHIKEMREEPILILEEALVPDYSHFHILRLFNVVINFPWTTSETKRNYWY